MGNDIQQVDDTAPRRCDNQIQLQQLVNAMTEAMRLAVEQQKTNIPPPGDDIKRHTQKEALHLTYYYFVFQGVILTAVYSTPEHVKCRFRWVPFTLSFLAGFLNLCALLRIMCEMMRDRQASPGRNEMRTSDQATLAAAAAEEDRNEDHPAPSLQPQHRNTVLVGQRCVWNWRRLAYAFGFMAIVIGFFFVTLAGSWFITCGDKSISPRSPHPA